MTNDRPKISGIVHSPLETATLALQTVKALQEDSGTGIWSGISDIDKFLVPLRDDNLVTVLGYTSHYKSGFMNWFGQQALQTIEPESGKFVAKVTWEQSVEEDTLSWLASDTGISLTRLARGEVDVDLSSSDYAPGKTSMLAQGPKDGPEWVLLSESAYRRGNTPLWVIGHSKTVNAEHRKARPRMTMTDIGIALEYICNDATDQKLEPAMIVLDYLQRIRPDRADGDNRREQMMEAVNRAKDAAVSFGCPVMLGVQSKREALDRRDKMPQINDGQETSSIEQSSDVSFGLLYPIKIMEDGDEIKTKTGTIEVTKNLLFVRILKQKLGAAPLTFALYVDPERNKLASLSTDKDEQAPMEDVQKEAQDLFV